MKVIIDTNVLISTVMFKGKTIYDILQKECIKDKKMKQFVQFAQKAFIVKDKKFLIIQKSSADKLNGGKWEIPGGRKEAGDDLDSQIKREVFNETGLKIIPKEPVGLWSFMVNKEIEVVVVARLCELEQEQQDLVLGDEIDNAKWVEINSSILNKYEFFEHLKPTLKQFLLKH